RSLPGFGFRRGHALGAPEEPVRGLRVPLEVVERHAQMNHEVGAAYLSWAWEAVFELPVHDPFQLDDPLLEVFAGYGLQALSHPVQFVHANAVRAWPHDKHWHSARRLDLAEVLRRGFVVSPSDSDAAQEQEQVDSGEEGQAVAHREAPPRESH